MFSRTRELVVTGGTFTDHHNIQQHYNTKKSAIDRLMEASSLGALHNSGERFDPPKCHPNTRTAVLEKLMDWVIGKVGWEIFVLWLYGPAGAGKSAIAQTFAEQCSRTNGLLASFFFSRSDPKRNNEKALVATLAYQVSQRIPGLWTILEPTIDRDPAIFQLNFETQFRTLILNPLLELSTTGLFTSGESLPYLFIIDGLDECKGSDVQKTILNTISNALQRHRFTLPFIFLISSRSERHLTIPFNDVSLSNLTLRLALDDTYQPDDDIRLYLVESFRDIRQTHIMGAHLPDSWPSDNDIAKLVTKSSGQFIYATTVIRYVSSPRHNPLNRLKVVQSNIPVNNDKPYAELDALYTNILSGVEDIKATLCVLGVALVQLDDNYCIGDLEDFMLLDPGGIQLLLLDLPSVIDSSDEDEPIKFLHASFEDFLFDPTRSLEFYISPEKMNEEAASLCITHISSFWSSDFTIQVGTDSPPNLDYAFRWLHSHLRSTGCLHHNAALRDKVLNVPYFQSHKKLGDFFPDSVASNPSQSTGFLDFLLTSDFWNTEEIYLRHRCIWDQVMQNYLATTPKNHAIAFWTAWVILVKELPFEVHTETIIALTSSLTPGAPIHVPLYFLAGATTHNITFDGERYDIDASLLYSNDFFLTDESLLGTLKDFLIDQSRAGPYTANETTYIIAAEFVIAFAVRPWDIEKERVPSDRKQWDFIWDAIISILSRARWSSELLDMLNRQSLTFVLGKPNEEVRDKLQSMFQTVSRYLLRCTGSVPAGFHIIIDWKKGDRIHDDGDSDEEYSYEEYSDEEDSDDSIRADIPFHLNSAINN